ncbi:MAG: UDP-2,3-diacylglucosamine diphosphatase LpxI [Planctomycetota bacterium]|nr:UDP-2,3-diacylglucosamine diphosphatase LpxI [Planctomycetota bacterium]
MSEDPHGSRDGAPTRLGLVAGGGTFPITVARAARARGTQVICIGLRGEVHPGLEAEVDAFKWLGLGRAGAAFRFFRRHGVRCVSWAGRIRKERLFTPLGIFAHFPDWRCIRFWYGILRRRDRQSQTLLAAVADEFEKEGFTVGHSAHFCPEILVEEGVLTKRRPSRQQLADIAFGWRVAKRMADLDVGQSVAVSERATVAVEGMEGTDRNILRAGELCKRGFVVVKVAKDGHDMRFDVPAVGPRTIGTMKAAGGKVLALEAGKTIILEREEVIRQANRHGIVVAAFSAPPPVD